MGHTGPRGLHARWRSILIALVATSTLALNACGSDDDGHDGHDHTGSDAHEHIDPVAEDPPIAVRAVATTLLNWTPAEQESRWDLPVNSVENLLTGELADKASTVSTDDQPKQWDDWASAKATVRTVVTDVTITDESDTEITATATARQDLTYPDGSRSTWKTTDIEVHLVAEDGRWKADNFKENE